MKALLLIAVLLGASIGCATSEKEHEHSSACCKQGGDCCKDGASACCKSHS